MADEDLAHMHFVMRNEVEMWRLSKFAFNRFAAVRWEGETVPFDDEYKATEYIRARGMEAALRHYHTEMAKGGTA